ncbi:MAG: septal ring lytic transglycosylase RlpA family protein [Alphaproteobacteria bacterium]
MRNLIAMAAIGLLLAGCGGLSGPRSGSETSGFGKTRGYYKVGAPYQVNGVWYYPRVDFGYDETGTASWYGEAFNGKPTANGETFDLTQVSAAHKTLQLPSVVEVTNLQNGRALKVRVNDRGPFAGDRIIDLSRRAAQLLGFERAGTAPVRVRVMKEESIKVAEAAMRGDIGRTRIAQDTPTIRTRIAAAAPRPAARAATVPARTGEIGEAAMSAPEPTVSQIAAEPPKPAPVMTLAAADPPRSPAPPSSPREQEERVDQETARRSMWPSLIASARAATNDAASSVGRQTRTVAPSGRIFVQVGAFALAENAHRARARIASLAGTEMARISANGTALYRVRLGPLASETEARSLLGKLAERGIHDARIVGD